jgi:small subunit ribosomal protein S6
MRQYELTYLISDLVPESDLNKVTGKIGGYISSLGGKTIKEEVWGRRKLAYPIKKQDFATYVTIIFELSADKAKELEHNINLTSKVIRHLMIILKAEATALSLTKEDIAETKEIEEVVGGEKSFEMIEGETEESRDLMAVRGEDGDQSRLDRAQTEEKVEETTPEVKEEEIVEEVAEEKPAKKAKVEKAPKGSLRDAKEEKPLKETPSETVEPVKTEKPKKVIKKESNEADRLSMLDKELDDILGDEIK